MRFALLCALAVLAIFAGTAQGSPAHRDAVLANTDEWIGSVLRVPIADRADVPGLVAGIAAGGAGVPCWDPGTAHYSEGLLERMADRHSSEFEETWATALHEHLHMRGGPCVYGDEGLDPAWRFWEEGLTEAVNMDLFPAFFRAHFGRRAWPAKVMPQYRENVAAVRAVSRYGSGSRTWRDRDAVLWRRARLLEDWPARQVAIAEAQGRAG